MQVKLQSSGLFPQFPIMLGGCSPRSTYYFYKLQKQHVCFIIYIAQRDHHWLAPMTAQPDIHHNIIYNSDKQTVARILRENLPTSAAEGILRSH